MGALTPCPPWLLTDAAKVLVAANANRLHHAWLVSGLSGIGKHDFCQWLAEALLCTARTEQGACGECPACGQMKADSHPDFLTVLPEGANAGVKIETVRNLVEWLQLTAGQNSYRVALITHANGLNRHSANSLLKTLEEPADNAVLIMCAERTGALPATVRSRCQKLVLTMGDKEAAITWLSSRVPDPERALLATSGRPYAALSDLDENHQMFIKLLLKAWSDLFLHKGSVGRIADSLSKQETSVCLAMLAKWCVLAAKHGVEVQTDADSDVLQVISQTQDRLNSEGWLTLHDRLLTLYRSDSASFRTQTVLEGLFADIRLMING